jgi:hypothetical protein
MAFASDGHPTKCHKLSHGTYILAHPAGLVSSAIFAEKQALELVPTIFNHDSSMFHHKHIFIGSDCQSGLQALAQGPLHDYMHGCGNLNWSSIYKSYLDTATAYDCVFHLQYTPAHVSIKPNEIVNNLAKEYARTFSQAEQNSVNIELSTLKASLNCSLLQQWINTTLLLGTRSHTCGLHCSNLKC